MTDLAGFLLLSAMAVWAAWEAARVLAWALGRLFGTSTGWLLIALMLGGVGLMLLRSDAEFATLAAFGCIAAAAIMVCAVEYVESARERDRRVRQRASLAQEQRRRDRERQEALAQAQSAAQMQSQPDEPAPAAESAAHPLNAEFIDGIWVVPDPGLQGGADAEKHDGLNGKPIPENTRPADDMALRLRAIPAPCPAETT